MAGCPLAAPDMGDHRPARRSLHCGAAAARSVSRAGRGIAPEGHHDGSADRRGRRALFSRAEVGGTDRPFGGGRLLRRAAPTPGAPLAANTYVLLLNCEGVPGGGLVRLLRMGLAPRHAFVRRQFSEAIRSRKWAPNGSVHRRELQLRPPSVGRPFPWASRRWHRGDGAAGSPARKSHLNIVLRFRCAHQQHTPSLRMPHSSHAVQARLKSYISHERSLDSEQIAPHLPGCALHYLHCSISASTQID